MKIKGKVIIVGAGPGDPGLMTLKGLEAIRSSDVILYDRLVSKEVLNLIPNHIKTVYGGKKGCSPMLEQKRIHRRMLKEVEGGMVVVHLKGGDPFLFGRGGEEMDFLRENGVDFEVIPGVSSAIAAPTYVGIPLTHRLYSSSVAVVTGQEDPRKKKLNVKWIELAGAVDTLVILMGVKNLHRIVEKVMSSGFDGSTPAAIIENGTTPDQRVVTAPLKMLVSRARKMNVNAPAIIVVGDVVGLYKRSV